MKNREAYKDILDDILGDVVAVADGKPVLCAETRCCRCLFLVNCGNPGHKKEIIDWLNAEYQEPSVDWSKVPIDTPVLASNDGENWNHRYFAGVSGQTGNPMAYNSGATSWSVDYGDTCEWPFMKLAEGNE